MHQVVHAGRIHSTGIYFRKYLEDLGAQMERATKVTKSVVTQSVSAKIRNLRNPIAASESGTPGVDTRVSRPVRAIWSILWNHIQLLRVESR